MLLCCNISLELEKDCSTNSTTKKQKVFIIVFVFKYRDVSEDLKFVTVITL